MAPQKTPQRIDQRLHDVLEAANSHRQMDSKLPYGTSLYWLKFAMHRLAGSWGASNAVQDKISNSDNFGHLYAVARDDLCMSDQEIAILFLHTFIDMHDGPRSDWMKLLSPQPYTAQAS